MFVSIREFDISVAGWIKITRDMGILANRPFFRGRPKLSSWNLFTGQTLTVLFTAIKMYGDGTVFQPVLQSSLTCLSTVGMESM